jgi:Na+-transporting methylmalonyl-CoA/oxaloacetate decarboxylase gamma subunit
MKLTRAIFLALAFLIPAVSTVAKAEDKPAAAEAAPAEGKKAKKSKKAKKEEKKEEAPADKK